MRVLAITQEGLPPEAMTMLKCCILQAHRNPSSFAVTDPKQACEAVGHYNPDLVIVHLPDTVDFSQLFLDVNAAADDDKVTQVFKVCHDDPLAYHLAFVILRASFEGGFPSE